MTVKHKWKSSGDTSCDRWLAEAEAGAAVLRAAMHAAMQHLDNPPDADLAEMCRRNSEAWKTLFDALESSTTGRDALEAMRMAEQTFAAVNNDVALGQVGASTLRRIKSALAALRKVIGGGT